MTESKGNKRTVYLVRHGETDKNAAQIAIGQRTDARLTTKGIGEAERVGAWFKSHKPDITVVWSSPLQRARMTAEHIARSIGAMIYERDELKEIDMGAVDGLTTEQAKSLYPAYYERRETDVYYRIHTPWPGGGESYIDAQQRVNPIAKELEVVEHDVVVVGHRAINKLLMGLLTHAPVEEIAEYAQGHNEIIEVTLSGRTIRLYTV
jgi:broad specificity phosphatase PhoE